MGEGGVSVHLVGGVISEAWGMRALLIHSAKKGELLGIVPCQLQELLSGGGILKHHLDRLFNPY